MTAYLYKTKLGESAREYFCKQIETESGEKAALILSTGALMRDVQKKHYTVQTMGMDTLASKILNMAGNHNLNILSNHAREMIVQDLVLKHAQSEGSSLAYFNNLAEKPGFIKALTSLFSQLSRTGQKIEDIQTALKHLHNGENFDQTEELIVKFTEIADEEGIEAAKDYVINEVFNEAVPDEAKYKVLNLLTIEYYSRLKDSDIATIYGEYRNKIEAKNKKHSGDNHAQGIYDLEGMFRLAIASLRRLGKKLSLPWKKLYICDFSSFHPLQIALLKEIGKHIELHIGMCYEQDRLEVFAAGMNTVNALQIDNWCTPATLPSDENHETTDVFAYLRQNLMRSIDQNFSRQMQTDAVRLYSFGDRESEIRWVLSDVKTLLKDKGVAPSQVTVLMRSLNNYTGIKKWADTYGIPITLKSAGMLALQPLTQFVLLLMQASAKFSHNAAVAYLQVLQSPLLEALGVDLQSYDDLRTQKYYKTVEQVRADLAGLRTADETVSDATSSQQTTQTDDMMLTIDSAIDSLNSMRIATAEAYGQWLICLLEELHIKERLGKAHKNNQFPLHEIAVCLQVCGQLAQTALKIKRDYEAAGKETQLISLDEWKETFVDMLKEATVAIEKGRTDGVTVDAAINAQGLQYDYVYIMGLCEGEFPQVGNENWIYNDDERNKLNVNNWDLPTIARSYAEEGYCFASAVASANKQLTLTYPEQDAEPSAYLDAVGKLFWKSQNINGSNQICMDNNGTKLTVKPEHISLLGKVPLAAIEAYRLGEKCDKKWLQSRFQSDELLAFQIDNERASDPISEYNGILYDTDLSTIKSFSASQLKTFINCPFRYMAERIWRSSPNEEKTEEMQAKDEGTFLHEVLQRFLEKLLQLNKPKEQITAEKTRLIEYDWNVLQAEMEQLFHEVSQQYIDDGTIVNEDIWAVQAPRLLQMLMQWLSYEYEEETQWTNYRPFAVEWEFGKRSPRSTNTIAPYMLKLQDGQTAIFNGSIDRIDTDGTNYVVTDYKRSQGSVAKRKAIDEGQDLQIPIYLLALEQRWLKEHKGNPSGGSYYVLKDGTRQEPYMFEDVGNENLAMKLAKGKSYPTWEERKSFFETTIRAYVQEIREGKFMAGSKNCKYCAMSDICRKSVLGKMTGGEENE